MKTKGNFFALILVLFILSPTCIANASEDTISLTVLLRSFKESHDIEEVAKMNYELQSENLELVSSSNIGEKAEAKLTFEQALYDYNICDKSQKNENQTELLSLLNSCLNQFLYQEQVEYYTVCNSYYYTVLAIVQKKKEKGYASEVDVNDALSDFLENQGFLEENKTLLEESKKEITQDKIVLPYIPQDTFSLTYVVSVFENRDTLVGKYSAQIDAYNHYSETLKEQLTTLQKRKLNVQVLQVKQQMTQRKNALKAYAKTAYKHYNDCLRKFRIEEQRYTFEQKKYQNSKMQYQKGKIAKIDLLKSQMNMEKQKIACDLACSDLWIWNFVIQNGLYEAQ